MTYTSDDDFGYISFDFLSSFHYKQFLLYHIGKKEVIDNKI